MLRTSAFALAVASLCLFSAGVSEAGWKKRCNTCDTGCNSCSSCNSGCSSCNSGCSSCNSGCSSCDSCNSCGTASTVAPNNNTAGGPPAAPQMAAQNGQTYRSFSYDSNGNAVSNNSNVNYQSAPNAFRSSNRWNHSAGDKALGNYGR